MSWKDQARDKVQGVARASRPLLLAAGVIGAIILVIWLFPGRTAAVLFGIMLAALIRLTVLEGAARTQLALLWMGVGIASDAAYARLNDLGPITVANALMKVVDAIVKLTEPMIRSFTLLPPDFRARLGAVTPEFVWAFILALIVLLAIAQWSGERR